MLVFGPRPGPDSVACRHREVETAVPAARWGESGFPVERTRPLDLVARLQREHPTLGDLADRYRVCDVGLNYNRATVAARSLYTAAEPADPRDVPRFRGRNFDRYTAVQRGGWLRHDAVAALASGERLSAGWAVCALPEKSVLRQTADGIVATLDRSRML